uniref:glutathione transferase n=1 Tax=Branchiostoma floridae TaxID=7739 RepID=C3XZV9_BRAFL|eukprot:XP_002610315.1 hypothetical protein BRAFLDRAFT_84048 [Branchiostoma floridae]
MPAYKLTYFNGRGTAEIVRLVFAAAGIAYEDVRLEQDKWPELKPKTPMGQVPILEVDGTMLCQSNSIARYVAKVAGLAGKTPMEQARVDMIMDVMDDMGKKGNAVFWEKDEETKLTLADITYFNTTNLVGNYFKFPNMDEFSGLKKVTDHVLSNPGIAKWLKERPETPF